MPLISCSLNNSRKLKFARIVTDGVCRAIRIVIHGKDARFGVLGLPTSQVASPALLIDGVDAQRFRRAIDMPLRNRQPKMLPQTSVRGPALFALNQACDQRELSLDCAVEHFSHPRGGGDRQQREVPVPDLAASDIGGPWSFSWVPL